MMVCTVHQGATYVWRCICAPSAGSSRLQRLHFSWYQPAQRAPRPGKASNVEANKGDDGSQKRIVAWSRKVLLDQKANNHLAYQHLHTALDEQSLRVLMTHRHHQAGQVTTG